VGGGRKDHNNTWGGRKNHDNTWGRRKVHNNTGGRKDHNLISHLAQRVAIGDETKPSSNLQGKNKWLYLSPGVYHYLTQLRY